MLFKYTVQKNIIQREPSLEPFISQSAKDSYFYSKQILKRPWPEGENIILTNSKYIHLYAKNVLKKRWNEGEERLLKEAEDWGNIKSGSRRFLKEFQDSVILYVKHLIKGRWKELEDFIINSPHVGVYLSILKDEKDIEEVQRKLNCEALADNSIVKDFLGWNPTHVVKMNGKKAFTVLLKEKNYKTNPIIHNAYTLEEWLRKDSSTSIEYRPDNDLWYWKRHGIYNMDYYRLKGTVTPLG